MKRLVLPLLIACCCIPSVASPSKVHHILTIISEPEDGLTRKFQIVENTAGVSMQVLKEEKLDIEFAGEKLRSGFVMVANVKGHDAIFLNCGDCDSNWNGTVEMKFLENGITDSYGSFHMILRKTDGSWAAFNRENNQKISKLLVKSNTLLGVLTGVESIMPIQEVR